jgi:beta-phosphoglucomutase family hydrolase
VIKAVIFDHDGVIADTEPMHLRADNAILARYGFSISAEANDSLVGVSTRKSWEILREMFKIPEAAEWLAEEKTSIAVSIIEKEGILPNDGLLQLLERLQSRGCRLAIASGQYRKVIDAVLARLKISHYFSVIVSGEDTTNGKPNPEVFLTAAKRLGVNPEECLVIEDSESGVIAARAAKMKCVALSTPSTASHDISTADMVVNSLAELQLESLDGGKRKQ